MPMYYFATLPQGVRLVDASWFYNVNSQFGGSDLLVVYRAFAQYVTDDILPIATDEVGYQTCPSLRSNSYGSIWFCNYLVASAAHSSSYRSSPKVFYYLYPDFSTFLNAFTDAAPRDYERCFPFYAIAEADDADGLDE